MVGRKGLQGLLFAVVNRLEELNFELAIGTLSLIGSSIDNGIEAIASLAGDGTYAGVGLLTFVFHFLGLGRRENVVRIEGEFMHGYSRGERNGREHVGEPS